MKLYDVIRKEDLEQGKPLPDIQPQKKLEQPKPYDSFGDKPKFSLKKILLLAAGALLLAALYLLGVKMVRAKVVVVERHIPFSLTNATLDLTYDTKGNAARLSFQSVIVDATVSRQVYGSELAPSTSKAKGKAVFFNEYSTTAQTVKAKTTITGSNGKRYQTLETVTVPGYTLKGKVKTPGTSTGVSIVALDIGPTSNSSGTDFVVNGWSGSRSKQFYARSAGAIIGGEDGVSHTVSEADRPGVVATLQAQLIERLKRETRTQIPDTLVAFPDLQFATIDNDSLRLSGPDINFPASLKGSMISYVIPRAQLERAIASRVLSDHEYATVSIPNLSALSITPVTPAPTDPAKIPDTVSIKITGQGTIITKAPLTTIREALVGKSVHSFEQVISGFSEIDSASYHLLPFWSPLFPSLEKRITVEVK